MRYGEVPDLVELTKLTADAIEDDLEPIFRVLIEEPSEAGQTVPVDGAMFTAVQIHGPEGTNLVWPRSGHVQIDGAYRRMELPTGADPAEAPPE